MADHWATPLIGKPWRRGATGPHAYDCRGLAYHVQRTQYGREMPFFAIENIRSPEHLDELNELIRRSHWHRMPAGVKKCDGDILLMRGVDGPHVGIVVAADGGLGVLHAVGSESAPGAVVFSPFDSVNATWGRQEVWRYIESEK